jgi:hypothetical protein
VRDELQRLSLEHHHHGYRRITVLLKRSGWTAFRWPEPSAPQRGLRGEPQAGAADPGRGQPVVCAGEGVPAGGDGQPAPFRGLPEPGAAAGAGGGEPALGKAGQGSGGKAVGIARRGGRYYLCDTVGRIHLLGCCAGRLQPLRVSLASAKLTETLGRRVIGWGLAGHLRASLTLEALEMALSAREALPGLVHHSDRGVRHARGDDIRRLERAGIQPGMSRPGCPWDNAMAESFMRTLKREAVDGRAYRDLEDARGLIATFLAAVYNRQRSHPALAYLAPEVYEASQPMLLRSDASGHGIGRC